MTFEIMTVEEFRNKMKHIGLLKRELQKLKEDIEQVELFGSTRDIAGKKARCLAIIKELKTLEGNIR